MENIQKKYIIAIDGPCATGKSCIAKLLAKKLSIIYVDTGAMYRVCAYYFITNNIKINEENAKKYMKEIDIKLNYTDGKIIIHLNNQDVTDDIRTPEISMGASDISKIPYVRERLVDMQRKMGEDISVIMDGRDIGSVVFPNADIKVYLDGDIKTRTLRRKKDLEKMGCTLSLEEIEKDMKKRDSQDMNRDHSPLIKVEDAILIDTTYMSVEEVVEHIMVIIKDKGIIKD
ncbi:MAG: (d)CMP kinase [Clostridia bacterium]|nr:(d)CMP kinase [Clostridia bacterium]MDD4386705.1 (d)CMP kinase [Clostridia bacterium]